MRLFIAFSLDDEVKEQLLLTTRKLNELSQREVSQCNVRWMKKEQLHLTLKFLGETKQQQLDHVTSVLDAASAEIFSFQFSISCYGCFPERGKARIVWAGLEEIPAELERCNEQVQHGCRLLGWKQENRAFTPHITIGRVREDRSKGEFRAALSKLCFEPLIQRVEAVTLYQSILQPTGSKYEVVYRAPLQT